MSERRAGEPITVDEAMNAIAAAGNKTVRSCCGTDPTTQPHLQTCYHYPPNEPFTSQPPPCPSCRMTGFHHGDCPKREGHDATNPKYYSHPSGVETIDVERHMTFCAGSAFKYMLRYEEKGDPPTDLRKGRWYVEDCRVYRDMIWNSPGGKSIAVPLVAKMLDYETNVYRQDFFTAVLDLDLDRMAAAVDAARASLQ